MTTYKGLISYRLMKESCNGNNCSGHGECVNGTCFCEIQFVGEECMSANSSYFAVFGSIFVFLAALTLGQLITCIAVEWRRLKTPSLSKACRVTTQKLCYFLVFLASALRGAYFTSPKTFEDGWTRTLLSAYYPLLLSGSSLIVCFWAEIFHLKDLRWERRQFLSKSFVAFVTFNLLSFSLLIAEVISSSNEELRSLCSEVSHAAYAVLLFVVMVFFLIYGVEVFFKVRGGFLQDETNSPVNGDETANLFRADNVKCLNTKTVDSSVLTQSRFGLLSQVLMLAAVVFCLSSETFKHLWKDKVPVSSRNARELLFRAAEIGVTLWFPCVLWNCVSPQSLWILNPKRLLVGNRSGPSDYHSGQSTSASAAEASTAPADDEEKTCWICFDSCGGDVIRPCACVATVHHDCLKKWLIQSETKHCLVCHGTYSLSSSPLHLHSTLMSLLSSPISLLLLFLLSSTLIFLCLLLSSSFPAPSSTPLPPLVKASLLGAGLLFFYVLLKLFSSIQFNIYKKTKFSSIRINTIS